MPENSLETTINEPKHASTGGLPWLFWGPQGLRAGWSLLLFLLLVWLSSYLIASVLGRIHPPPLFQLAYGEFLQLLATLVATGIMILFERNRPGFYGFGATRMLPRFASGAFVGFISLSIFLFALTIFGHFFPGNIALHGKLLAGYAALWAVAFLLVGLLEEILFRGYALATLARGMGFWPAALLLSLIFGAVHIQNPKEDWFGALSAGLCGLVLCFSIRRSGSLWWAIGFHSMWDYSQSFLYSTADSGVLVPGHLLNSHFSGPSWITGGNVGPEGSLFILPLLAAIAGFIHMAYPPRANLQASDQHRKNAVGTLP